MNDIIEAQTLHLGPVVKPLEKLFVALVDELFVSSFCHLYLYFYLYALTNTCKSNKKSL